ADVDNFIARTRSNLNDQRAVQVALKAKSVARKVEQAIINGDSTVDTNSFDGLKTLCTSGTSGATGGQTIEVGTSGGALTLALMRASAVASLRAINNS